MKHQRPLAHITEQTHDVVIDLIYAGMANHFYRERVDQHLRIGIHAVELLRADGISQLHSRKLRSFSEVAFQQASHSSHFYSCKRPSLLGCRHFLLKNKIAESCQPSPRSSSSPKPPMTSP
ncbi:hypothetical protein SAMN05216344_11042 [Polaromonas sp. OV174]|uniref:hypothetical protein n=1 Tax=Polaromonas sp. OV174 TaxID=1855300 RepID=UPI0008E39AA7|nr:hypothetical protein [Polaromonas sp. OV174]SFC15614.1 hypothetical protein SAMN05216344_11042 [Polaromonas sp. OV174]